MHKEVGEFIRTQVGHSALNNQYLITHEDIHR